MTLVKAAIRPAFSTTIASRPNVNRINRDNLNACFKTMSTGGVVWATTRFLTYKHRVILLTAWALAASAYIVYDKVYLLFF